MAPRLRFLLVPLLLCIAIGLLRADAIVMTMAMKASTIAEFFIEEDRIRVELEIGVSELEAFRNLLPDSLYEKMGFEPEPLKKRFARFLAEDFVLGPPGGPLLEGWIESIEGRRRVPRDPISGEPLTMERLMGWAFMPFALLMGTPPSEAFSVGSVLGTRTVINELVAFEMLRTVGETLLLVASHKLEEIRSEASFAAVQNMEKLHGLCTWRLFCLVIRIQLNGSASALARRSVARPSAE